MYTVCVRESFVVFFFFHYSKREHIICRAFDTRTKIYGSRVLLSRRPPPFEWVIAAVVVIIYYQSDNFHIRMILL